MMHLKSENRLKDFVSLVTRGGAGLPGSKLRLWTCKLEMPMITLVMMMIQWYVFSDSIVDGKDRGLEVFRLSLFLMIGHYRQRLQAHTSNMPSTRNTRHGQRHFEICTNTFTNLNIYKLVWEAPGTGDNLQEPVITSRNQPSRTCPTWTSCSVTG